MTGEIGDPSRTDSARRRTRSGVKYLIIAIIALSSVVLGAILVLSAALNNFASSTAGDSAHCNIWDNCSGLSLADISAQTGYTFPADSEVLESSEGDGFLSNDWSLLARLALPKGSDVPTSEDPASSISIIGSDDAGRLIVSVHAS